MFDILEIPSVTFNRIRNEQNKKIENYIKRLEKFWKTLIILCDKEPSLEEGKLIFKPTYLNKQKLICAGFKEKTIKNYLSIFEQDGYISRSYNTYNNGISKKTGKSRKIGHSLFITLHLSPITQNLNKTNQEKAFLKELANSKSALILNNLKIANL